MKKPLSLIALSIAVALLFGWMLATPVFEINPAQSMPAVADGGAPMPPPPYLVADGGAPMPPPPYLVADGGAPMPPPPYSV